MLDLNNVLDRGFAQQNGLNARVIAVQEETHFGMAHMRVAHTVDDGLRGMITPHGINRNNEFAGQYGAILQAKQQAPQ